MSALPEVEQHPPFNKDVCVQHIIEQQIAKHQIVQLQAGQLDINAKLASLQANLAGEIKALRETIEKQPSMVYEARKSIRTDVEKDFVTKAELRDTENRIGLQIATLDRKVGEQWLKITIPIGAITAPGVALNWGIAFGKGLGLSIAP